ncbi:MAG: hypothetical protein ACLQVX_05505 [Limisphaerales bacterium]
MRTKYLTHCPGTWTLGDVETMQDVRRGVAGCHIRPKEAAPSARELSLSPIPFQKTVRDAVSHTASAQALQEDLPADMEDVQAALLGLAFTGNS